MSIWWWQRAVSQPALLQALLFLTAGHHATLESNNGVSSTAIEKSIKDSLRLRGNTLKTLNDILQDPIKAVAESTTLIVASLVAIEAVDANFEAVHAHMKGLKRLINLLGGLDALDHMTLSKIYQYVQFQNPHRDEETEVTKLVQERCQKRSPPKFPSHVSHVRSLAQRDSPGINPLPLNRTPPCLQIS
jgi:hypothetical protein